MRRAGAQSGAPPPGPHGSGRWAFWLLVASLPTEACTDAFLTSSTEAMPPNAGHKNSASRRLLHSFCVLRSWELGGGPRRNALEGYPYCLARRRKQTVQGASGTFGPKTRPLSAAYEVS
jgi:hypothetical protein